MTTVERQILINQIAIMSSLMHILYDGKFGNTQEIEDLAKCTKMTYSIINNCENLKNQKT